MATIRTTTDVVAPLSVPARRGISWHRVFERAMPYLLIAPLLVLIGIFIYWPLIYSSYLSFFDWNFVRPDKTFVGWDNYTRLADDPRFMRSLRGTAVYVVTLVPIQVFLPLGLALLLWPIRRAKSQSAYRIMLFSPTVIAY
jgi:ABC-type sugar transport system permease subunit